MITKNMNVMKLPRGYCFKTDHLRTINQTFAQVVDYVEKEDFIPVRNTMDLVYVSEIMQVRILNYHISNGVIIENPRCSIIDADVEIGKGVNPFAITPFQ